MIEKQDSMDQSRKLYREYIGLTLLEEEHLMSFKCRFAYIVQKYLKPLAVIENREFIEFFVKILDNMFWNTLNSRLSIQGMLKVDVQERSCMKDLYDLEHVIQKAIDLVSSKTIAKTLKHTLVILSRSGKIDPDSREPVYFIKEKAVSKVEAYPDMEALQQNINILKTLYKKQKRS